ncbi:hypothetical protein ABZ079_01100 [Streptomyces sp. NPDC006314]|uniref:hypothetical protein n=1 Tax=Streptomyces sp. NPDC006314 TaxID=3154475 RepID=UPI0033BB1EE2
MNMSLFPLPQAEIQAGFDRVVARCRELAAHGPAEAYCDLGEEGGVLKELLLRAGVVEITELALFGGALLGDDGAGTICAFLSAGEVQRVDGVLSGIRVDEVMSVAPDVLAGIVVGGIPEGYAEDLGTTLTEVCALYGRAARAGLCMAHLHEG